MTDAFTKSPEAFIDRDKLFRSEQLLIEPRPAGKYRARPCPVCGETWIPWAGSRLHCHARCMMTDAGVEYIAQRWRGRGGVDAIAKELRLPRSVITATLRHRLGISVRG